MTPRRLSAGRLAAILGAGAGLFVLTCAWGRGPKATGEDVHRPGADCEICHTAIAAVLNSNRQRAKTLLRPDLEATCIRCHGAQGVSHKTGIRPKTPVAPELPLSADGKITCATCHFMHGESNAFGDFDRLDNRRGKLCLSCHKISELQ